MTKTYALAVGDRVMTHYGSHRGTEYGTVVRLPSEWDDPEQGEWYDVELDAVDGHPAYRLSLDLTTARHLGRMTPA